MIEPFNAVGLVPTADARGCIVTPGPEVMFDERVR